MSYTQKDRSIKVKTPLGDDALMLRAMSGKEELGRLFQFDLDLLSHDEQIKLEDVLGQNLTVELMLPEGKSRYFNGIVSRFCQVGESNGFYTYQATLHPWFWLLTRTSDCRIFQNKTVIEIVEEIFKDEGFSDYKISLSGDYRKWENCVQYRETDFNFINRLFEQEGLYYYFAHEDGKHTLHITDSISGHDEIATPNINYFPPSGNIVRDEDYIQEWSITRNLQPGAYAHRDFDFKNPKANLESKLANPFDHDRSNYEIYDYPGEYVTAGEGSNYVRTRLEELHTQYEKATGEGNVRTLYTGGLFTLHGYHREDQNREYLVISSTYHLQGGGYGNNSQDDEDSYQCSFEVINSQQQYRSSRLTPKPIVQGPQTAIIVGPTGEEIYTDEFGRVKVQFHWDRYGKNDENSSCWTRVSYSWAGKKWGSISLPRIGQEVIISFVEGDPDQPIITGRVYNADNMPPYELPANATQSGVKSRSSKDGSIDNFNEIRFEDKKGSEEIYIHAELNQKNIVENNTTINIGNDRSITIKGDHTENVTHNHEEIIGGDQIINITGDQKVVIEGDHIENIKCDHKETIDGDQIIKITGDKTETIGGPVEKSTTGSSKETNWSFKETTTHGFHTDIYYGLKDESFYGAKTSKNLAITNELFVGAKISNTLAATAESFVGAKISVCKAKEIKSAPTLNEIIQTKSEHKCATYLLDAITEIFLEAGSTFELKCGGSSIKITPSEIVIKASAIKFDGEVEGLKDANYKKVLKNPNFKADS